MATLEQIDYQGTLHDLTGLVNRDGDASFDLALCDDNGNKIAVFKDGHIRTKNFDSSNIPGSKPNPVVIVDKNGNGDYTTISSAIDNTQDGDTIVVCPGTYEEIVEMWGKNRHLVGICKDTCILTNGTGNYDTPPLEANIGSVENLTIIADNYAPTILDPTTNNTRASYGIHIEYANATPYTFRITNCKIVSKWCAGIGLGLRYNQTVIIEDSELVSNCVSMYSSYLSRRVEMGGLYFHNDTSNNNSTGKLIVSNTRLRGKKAALVMQSVDSYNAKAEAEFLNCTLSSEDYGVSSSVIYRFNDTTTSGKLCGDKITLAESSHGNNNEELNA